MGGAHEQRAIVHIGTHKTGSTSLQYWLTQHATELQTRHGLGVYRPIHPNGRELALLCADPDRSIPTIREIPEWRTEAWRTPTWGHVRSEVERTDEVIFFSNETLSLLRAPEELERLRELLAPRVVDIVLVTRKAEDFLRSWREQLTRDGFAMSQDPTSFAYLERDSWLVDYDEIVRANRGVFGESHVHVVDYDAAMARINSVIPAVMAHAVSDVTTLPDWAQVRRNRGTRPHPNESGSGLRNLLRRALGK
jgi:hypothetical protein